MMLASGIRLRVALVTVDLLIAALSCNLLESVGEDDPTATVPPAPTATVPVVPTSEPEVDSEPDQVAVEGTTEELARATVQILALYELDGDLGVAWTGSGSVIAPEGLILTNAHVVDDRYGDYTQLGIARTGQTDQPPELRYLAEIEAVDYALDLAVIRIVTDLEGNPFNEQLPFIAVGDSDTIQLGGKLRILGYPGIGGDTITFTEGAVSGFTQERGIEGRAWIKTDATIAGGNSGGMAANANGQLVGVPTRASAGDPEGDVVDCRPVADTNRDGIVDDNDTCVPIGGFINGIRPVNLALPMIDAVRAGEEYVGGPQVQPPSAGYDMSDVLFYNVQFSDGVTADDQPTQLWYALPSGATQICAFWDYEGMQDGMVWSAYWFVNGSLSEGGSILDNFWSGGNLGNWWVCISDERGLADGLYELSLEVEGETMVSDAVFVGGNRTTVDFVVINNSSINLCYVQISPTEAQNWGQDELGLEETIQPGSERAFQVATGFYDMRLLDCETNTLLEEYEMDLSGPTNYTVTD